MKYKYNGQWYDISLPAFDSLPVGAQVEYTGTDIPDGWEQVNDYSTTEMDTGKKWIDGKTIYRKVYKFTSLTNSTENILGTINNVSSVVALYGTANEDGNVLSLPHSDFSNIEWNIGLQFNNNQVIVKKGGWGTVTTNSFVVIEYTKSS